MAKTLNAVLESAHRHEKKQKVPNHHSNKKYRIVFLMPTKQPRYCIRGPPQRSRSQFHTHKLVEAHDVSRETALSQIYYHTEEGLNKNLVKTVKYYTHRPWRAHRDWHIIGDWHTSDMVDHLPMRAIVLEREVQPPCRLLSFACFKEKTTARFRRCPVCRKNCKEGCDNIFGFLPRREASEEGEDRLLKAEERDFRASVEKTHRMPWLPMSDEEEL